MDRRGFLRTTFVAGLASGTGCAADMADRAAAAPLDDAALERKLAKLERTLARMDGRFASEWFLAQRAGDLDDPNASERLLGEGELVRTALRVATLVSTVAELPEASQRDPRVVAQVSKLIDEADYAVFGSLAQLDALDDSAFAALDLELAEGEHSIERMSEQVESLAHTLDVPLRQRLHLRTMTKQIGWRLQREGSAVVVRDSVAKTDAMLEGAARRIAAHSSARSPDASWIARTQAFMQLVGPAEGEAAPEDAGASEAGPGQAVASEAVPTEAVASEPAATQPEPSTQAPVVAEPAQLPPSTTPEAAPAVVGPTPSELRAAKQAEFEKVRRTRNILLGTGAGMIVVGAGLAALGGVLLPADIGATLTIGGVGLTTGVILLILGIWMAVRTKRLRRELEG